LIATLLSSEKVPAEERVAGMGQVMGLFEEYFVKSGSEK
jgi:hypothetical protein